jgi:hypothetical protein
MTISESAVQTIRDAANLFCAEVESFIANSGNVSGTGNGTVDMIVMTTTEEDTLEAVTIALYGIGSTVLGADLYNRLVALEAALDTYAGE